MSELFHVTDGAVLHEMRPRPSPPGADREARPLVWAIDLEHLPNYLLPRECPRVCWQVGKHEDGILASPAPRVVAIEQRWLARSTRAGLLVHHLAPDGFRLADSAAGYWTSSQ
ncbi:DUF6886 family protein, partial [Jatrophihabitans endophyticus]|uniref:DUF6886 family protein n=1 Tax=Jatrophihabitans endophyticus TaxID=1206085 RepID=UPI0019FBACF2|nr:hypothetical protein [Jatrophihabitans endophyticus]